MASSDSDRTRTRCAAIKAARAGESKVSSQDSKAANRLRSRGQGTQLVTLAMFSYKTDMSETCLVSKDARGGKQDGCVTKRKAEHSAQRSEDLDKKTMLRWHTLCNLLVNDRAQDTKLRGKLMQCQCIVNWLHLFKTQCTRT